MLNEYVLNSNNMRLLISKRSNILESSSSYLPLNSIVLDTLSYIQMSFTNTTQPVFEMNRYKPSYFLEGKDVYQGKILFNGTSLNPLNSLYILLENNEEYNPITKHENYVFESSNLVVENKNLKTLIILRRVFFIGYLLETTLDSSPLQFVHNLLFQSYTELSKQEV